MTVRIERQGHVTTIVNDRINARNAVDPDTAEALTDAFVAFERDPDARVAVFYGEGGAFCGGWDLKYAATMGEREAFERDLVNGLAFPMGASPAPRGPMGPSRMEFNKPVIAAVEGPAVAGGMELAMLADMRVMAEDAYFGVYCRRWGIPLLDGGTVRIPRLVGLGRAMEIVLTGRKVSADEALRIGLCERVVPRGSARAAATELAHEIARFPQAAVLADRRNMYETYGLPVREALQREWANGLDAIAREGAAGAARFAGGKGRHGDFSSI